MVKTSEGIKSIININTTEIESINCFNINIIEETFAFVVSSFFNRFVTTIAKKKKKKNLALSTQKLHRLSFKSIREIFVPNTSIV